MTKKIDKYINLIEEKYGHIASIYFRDKIVEYTMSLYKKINSEMKKKMNKETGND